MVRKVKVSSLRKMTFRQLHERNARLKREEDFLFENLEKKIRAKGIPTSTDGYLQYIGEHGEPKWIQREMERQARIVEERNKVNRMIKEQTLHKKHTRRSRRKS